MRKVHVCLTSARSYVRSKARGGPLSKTVPQHNALALRLCALGDVVVATYTPVLNDAYDLASVLVALTTDAAEPCGCPRHV